MPARPRGPESARLSRRPLGIYNDVDSDLAHTANSVSRGVIPRQERVALSPSQFGREHRENSGRRLGLRVPNTRTPGSTSGRFFFTPAPTSLPHHYQREIGGRQNPKRITIFQMPRTARISSTALSLDRLFIRPYRWTAEQEARWRRRRRFLGPCVRRPKSKSTA